MNPNSYSLDQLLAEEQWVRALVRGLVASPDEDADDLTQQVFLKALTHPPRKGGGLPGPRAWLRKVAERLAFHSQRSSQRRRHHEAEVEPPAITPAAAEVVARVATRQRVVEAVMALDEPYRSTTLGRYFEGMEVAAMAEQWDTTPAAIRKRLSRARSLLRDRLQDLSEERSRSLPAVLSLWWRPRQSFFRRWTLPATAVALGMVLACFWFVSSPTAPLPESIPSETTPTLPPVDVAYAPAALPPFAAPILALNERGLPAAGVSLEIGDSPGPSTTDLRGLLTVPEHVDRESLVGLRSVRSEFAARVVPVWDNDASPFVVVAPATSREGWIRNGDGKGIAGAIVRVLLPATFFDSLFRGHWYQFERSVARTVANGSGFFELPAFPQVQGAVLEILAPGHATERMALESWNGELVPRPWPSSVSWPSLSMSRALLTAETETRADQHSVLASFLRSSPEPDPSPENAWWENVGLEFRDVVPLNSERANDWVGRARHELGEPSRSMRWYEARVSQNGTWQDAVLVEVAVPEISAEGRASLVVSQGKVLTMNAWGAEEVDQDLTRRWGLYLSQLLTILTKVHFAEDPQAPPDWWMPVEFSDPLDAAFTKQRSVMAGNSQYMRVLSRQSRSGDPLPPSWMPVLAERMESLLEIVGVWIDLLGEDTVLRYQENGEALVDLFYEMEEALEGSERERVSFLQEQIRETCSGCHNTPVGDPANVIDQAFAAATQNPTVFRWFNDRESRGALHSGKLRLDFDLAPALGDESGEISAGIAAAVRLAVRSLEHRSDDDTGAASSH